MPTKIFQRLSRLTFGAAFIALLLPACDLNINVENENKQGGD